MSIDNIRKLIIGSRLRNRFNLFFIALAAFPLLALGGTSIYFIDLFHRIDVSNLELQLIDQKIEEVVKFFNDTLGILELRVGFTQKSEIELSQQQFLLEGLLAENRAFEEVSFIGLSGIETAKKSRGDAEMTLANVSQLPKFQETVGGKNFISGVYYTLSGPSMTLAAPVRNRNGDIIQVLSAEVNLAQISRSIINARLGSSGYLVLLDKDGSLIGVRGPAPAGLGDDLSWQGRVRRIIGGEVLDGLGDKDRYESFFGKIPVVGAGKKIPTTGWMLLAEWPIQDADAAIQGVRNQVVQFTIFSIIAVFFLVPIFANRLLKPIKTIEAGAAEIEKGNFEKRVAIKTRDELEDLGNAFNKMAQGLKRLQELRDEFVFVAAHELRAPVTVIKGYLSMVLGGEGGVLPKQAKQFLEEVEGANKRLLRLVEDLLQIARAEAGRIVIEVAPLDIRSPIRAILQELKPLADEKSILLEYRDSGAVPEVSADDNRVKEIMMNLVDNAIKYTPGKGRVTVFHEIQEQELITHVQDNGFGISKEAQKKLFEKFYRIQTEKTQNITGTGLGLFIVKQLIEKMGGRIWVESEENKGSRFSFSLPRA